jgi:tRNA A37 N6-isopentenylltransferase MiaA
MFILIALATFSFVSVAAGSDLDQDCNPHGWGKQFSAWWNPVEFWSAQPSAIQQEVESRVKGYQIFLVQRQANVAIAAIEREKARIEQGALEEQLRILGVKSQPNSPEISQMLAQANELVRAGQEHIDEAMRQGVENTIRWGERCMAFSREQLAKARR